jgi:hypothetical protein
VDAPDRQHLAVQFHLADRVCLETTVSCRDVARLQRALLGRIPLAVHHAGGPPSCFHP